MLRACSIKVVGVILLGTAVLVYVVLLLVLAEVHSSRGLHQGLDRLPIMMDTTTLHIYRCGVIGMSNILRSALVHVVR